MATNNTWNSQNPAQVSKGGSGSNSVDPYAVICGGGTPTDPLQNVTGTGNAGQVLNSHGAGSLPSWEYINETEFINTPYAFFYTINPKIGFSGTWGSSPYIYDVPILNKGNCWDDANSRFVAPADGLYYFNMHTTFYSAVLPSSMLFFSNEIEGVYNHVPFYILPRTVLENYIPAASPITYTLETNFSLNLLSGNYIQPRIYAGGWSWNAVDLLSDPASIMDTWICGFLVSTW